MKKFKIWSMMMLVVMALTTMVACGGDDDAPSNNNPQNPSSSFTSLKGLQVSDIKVDASQHSTSVNISNGSLTGCTIVSSTSWCVAEISGTKVNLQIQENTSYDDRNATVTLTQPQDNSSLSFNVIQSKQSVIQVEKDIYEVSEDGGTITIDVKSNVEYTVDLAGYDWITTSNDNTRALQNSTIKLVVAPNNTGSSREAVIAIKDKDNKISRNITIKQTFTAQIITDKETYSVSEDGGTVSIDVKSNVEYTVDLAGYDWITLSSTRALQSSTIQLYVAQNNSGNSREAVITIKDKNNKISKSITIKQEFTSQLIIDTNLYNVSEDGGTVSIDVKSNVEYTVDLSGYDWITLNNTRALQKSTITLFVQANDTGYDREAVIKIKTKDGRASTSVTIKQKSISLTVSPASISLHYDDTKQLYANPSASSWSVEDDFIAKVDNNGLVTARHVGSTNVIASKGSAKASCHVTVTPQYTAYDTPIMAWGQSQSIIRASETHSETSSSTSSTLVYNYTFGSNVCVMGYYFKENKLNAIIAMMPFSSSLYIRIGYFLIERYQPVGQDGSDYYFMDAMDAKNATKIIVFSLTSSYITVTYMDNSTINYSLPALTRIKSLRQNTVINTDLLKDEIVKKYQNHNK